MQVIGVLSDSGVGGTFLTWSLHYLAGHTEYFSVEQNKTIELPHNPLTGINSHNFKPNQPTLFSQVSPTIDTLANTQTSQFHTVYFHDLQQDLFGNENFTGQAINYAKQVCTKLIYVSLSDNHALYQCKYQARDLVTKFNKHDQLNKTFEEQHQDYLDTFFSNSQTHWQQLNLTNSWDQREFLALNLRPFKFIKLTDYSKFDFDHYLLDSFNLFTTFASQALYLFQYLGVTIDPERWIKWQKIYQHWQQYHYDRLRFVQYFDQIIDNILIGSNMDLLNFDLDIVREAAIQHVLIYRHNLNLKTWFLEKFLNTKQLHQLLEPNNHSLTQY